MLISRFRQRLFLWATLALLSVSIVINWNLLQKFGENSPKQAEASQAQSLLSYKERVYSLHTRILIGLFDFLEQQQKTSPSSAAYFATLRKEVRGSIKESLILERNSLLETSAEINPKSSSIRLIRYSLIIAYYLRFNSLTNDFCKQLEQFADFSTSGDGLDILLLRLCLEDYTEQDEGIKQIPRNSTSGSGQNLFSPEEIEVLNKRLGWFGSLLAYSTAKNSSEKDKLAQAVIPMARRTFFKTLIGLLGACVVALVSFFAFSYFVVASIRGRLRSSYQPAAIPTSYSLEIFCLYLAGIICASQGVRLLSSWGTSALLIANIIGISSLSLIILWPMLFGEKLAAIRKQLGLNFFGIRRFISDILLGPFSYLSSLGPLLIVLILYSLLLVYLDVDPAQGAHPIVPIITQSKDSHTFYLVVFMAVVVAPLVEEIMFRGALYSWLREKMGALSAIFLSSLVFAAIHPQGLIGLLPLTCIGLILALLREWRGNLTSCMVTHACFNAGTLTLVSFFLR